MAVLVLLNGPPASGKSTIAQRFYDAFVRVVAQRPATRRVEVVTGDIDQTYTRFEEALDIGAQ